MTFQYISTTANYSGSTINFVPTSGALESVFMLKELLKTCGWVVTASSDGNTQYVTGTLTGDCISNFTSGSGGIAISGSLSNASAWFCIVSPNSQSWVFQRDSFANHTRYENWRIKWASDLFDIGGFGSGSITRAPLGPNSSSLSQSIIVGSGSDQSPSFQVFFRPSLEFRFNAMADNQSPYGWYVACTDLITGSVTTILMHDPVVSGTYASNDSSPYCVFGRHESTNTVDASLRMQYATSGPVCWFNKNITTTSTGSIKEVQALRYVGSDPTNVTLTTVMWPLNNSAIAFGPSQSLEVALPVLYARRSGLGAPSGFKGVSYMTRYPAVDRVNGTIYSNSFFNYMIKFGNILLPWPSASINYKF